MLTNRGWPVPLAPIAPLVTGALIAVATLAACDRDGPSPPDPSQRGAAPAVPVASVARALGLDASELETPVDPPPAPGDLRAEIDAFTSVEACVEQRARLDPLLGDALEAIGYDTFVRDACRVLDAARAKDPARCGAIDASSLRQRCESTVASVAGTPDACPWAVASRPELGRDAFCLAVASRDPRLCAASESSAGRTTCEAIVRRDATGCGRLPGKAEAARCRRDVERWKGVVTPADGAGGASTTAALPAAEGTLRVSGGSDGDGGRSDDASLLADLARGVVVLDQRDGARFGVGSPLLAGGGGGSFVATSPHALASFYAEVFAGDGGKRTSVERVALSLPGRAPLATPLAHSTLTAKVDRLDRTRGGAVSLTLEGDLGDSTGTVHVVVKATTFVRDVVSGRALYGAGGAAAGGGSLRRGFGDAGVMR